MGFGNTRCLRYAGDYAACKALFERSVGRCNDKWQSNERPLDGSAAGWNKHHYRVRYDGEESGYAVVLDRTYMARFRMLPDGAEEQTFLWHHSRTSSSFIWDVLGHGESKQMDTTCGKRVWVPFKEAEDVTLVLVDGKLDLSRSVHGPLYTWKMSDGTKETRKQFKKDFEKWILAALTKEAGVEYEITSLRDYRAFKGPQQQVIYEDLHALASGTGNEKNIQHWMEHASEVHAFAQGRARYQYKPLPNAEQLEQALWRSALSIGVKGHHDRVRLETQFPEVTR